MIFEAEFQDIFARLRQYHPYLTKIEGVGHAIMQDGVQVIIDDQGYPIGFDDINKGYIRRMSPVALTYKGGDHTAVGKFRFALQVDNVKNYASLISNVVGGLEVRPVAIQSIECRDLVVWREETKQQELDRLEDYRLIAVDFTVTAMISGNRCNPESIC